MERRWSFYDGRKIRKEFASLPDADQKSLARAMERYRVGDDAGFRHSDYGDGIEMLTDGGRGQGRCLYFEREVKDGTEFLTILLFYKKETEKAPANIIETARKRRLTYLREKDHADKPAEGFNPEPESEQ